VLSNPIPLVKKAIELPRITCSIAHGVDCVLPPEHCRHLDWAGIAVFGSLDAITIKQLPFVCRDDGTAYPLVETIRGCDVWAETKKGNLASLSSFEGGNKFAIKYGFGMTIAQDPAPTDCPITSTQRPSSHAGEGVYRQSRMVELPCVVC
jgi:hypothetical protein